MSDNNHASDIAATLNANECGKVGCDKQATELVWLEGGQPDRDVRCEKHAEEGLANNTIREILTANK